MLAPKSSGTFSRPGKQRFGGEQVFPARVAPACPRKGWEVGPGDGGLAQSHSRSEGFCVKMLQDVHKGNCSCNREGKR